MERPLCTCCYRATAEFSVSYKPDSVTFQVPICNKCFEKYKITGAFLAGCLENQRQQMAYRQRQKPKLIISEGSSRLSLQS